VALVKAIDNVLAAKGAFISAEITLFLLHYRQVLLDTVPNVQELQPSSSTTSLSDMTY
jgi:hypothetical protein